MSTGLAHKQYYIGVGPFYVFSYVQYNIFTITTSKTGDYEVSSNMHMYYAFGKHIYSLSSMNTQVFFVWQTYFVFCTYANNFVSVHTYV